MAHDRGLLDEAESTSHPMTRLRLYRWTRATVSIGNHQQPDRAFDFNYCDTNGIPWVRRPSGGRAVFHSSELTYAVVSNDARIFPPGSLVETYERLAGWLVEGMSRAGISARITHRQRASPLSPGGRAPGPCFLSPTRDAVTWAGRRLVGSAQRRARHSFLQHGSIPLQIDYPHMGAALAVEPDHLRQRVISASEAAGAAVGFHHLARALEAAFLEMFC